MADQATACIGLGSNLGDSLTILRSAWQLLLDHPAIDPLKLSAPYRTEPVGMVSDNWFANAAVLLRTTLSPDALLSTLLEMEDICGRERETGRLGYQDRTLDLDLLLYEDKVIRSPRLTLPHPELPHRLFVLAPLAEIAGNHLHPTLGLTVSELLHALTGRADNPVVEKGAWDG